MISHTMSKDNRGKQIVYNKEILRYWFSTQVPRIIEINYEIIIEKYKLLISNTCTQDNRGKRLDYNKEILRYCFPTQAHRIIEVNN